MAAFDSAIAIDDSGVIFGDQADVAASANADAAAEAISVDGIAAGNAVVTAAVGVLDSNVTVGADATVDVDQIGVADASSDTVNRTSVVAAGATSGALGDRVIDATTGATLGYIINASTGTYAATPDSSVVIGTLAAGNLLAGSSAFAGFTGRTGGMIDDGAIAADLVVGDGGAITVDAGNLADAEASNVDGDAYATARINETLGLDNVEVSVGASGSLFANVDADALASAVSVGDPTVTAAGSGADANADADATTVVGIQDFDAIVFGDNATVTARAGSSADRV
ncbi:MAG: hypothetical protein QM522_11925, partial [Chitinophagaceae bacterium]|nr:hypothetical protein [Chitinophagaceae bacterium]